MLAMKRTVSFFLSVLLALSLLAGRSSCGGGATAGLEYSLLSDGTYAVMGGAKGETTIRIPAEHEGIPVTALADRAFEYRDEIRALHLPASVTQIGRHAFGYSDSLATVTVDEGNPVYYSDGNCLIERASGRVVLGGKRSRIPNDGSITVIGESAFLGRASLTTVVIPSGVTAVESYAFAGCEALSSLTLPDGVTVIGDNAFAFCTSLSSLTVPASVRSVGYGVFEGCEEALTVTYGGTVAEWNETFGARYLGATALTVNCTDGVIENAGSYIE